MSLTTDLTRLDVALCELSFKYGEVLAEIRETREALRLLELENQQIKQESLYRYLKGMYTETDKCLTIIISDESYKNQVLEMLRQDIMLLRGGPQTGLAINFLTATFFEKVSTILLNTPISENGLMIYATYNRDGCETHIIKPRRPVGRSMYLLDKFFHVLQVDGTVHSI